jgi:hypothetical protein
LMEGCSSYEKITCRFVLLHQSLSVNLTEGAQGE